MLHSYRDAVCRKRNEIKTDYSWILYHINAPTHTELRIRHQFVKKPTHVVPSPPYPPDLTPHDFWIFHILKKAQTRLEIKALNTIPENVFSVLSEIWKKRYNKINTVLFR